MRNRILFWTLCSPLALLKRSWKQISKLFHNRRLSFFWLPDRIDKAAFEVRDEGCGYSDNDKNGNSDAFLLPCGCSPKQKRFPR